MVRKQAGLGSKITVATEPGSNLLWQEYSSLINLYTHSENTLFSIFNFYVTLLTTFIGAIIVIFQLGEKNISNPFSAMLLLLVFVVLLGIISQDALIHKNVDLAHYALALNAAKAYALKNEPEAQAHVFYLWDLHTRVNPLKYQMTLDEKIDRYLWWMLPIGMPQLFISLMNSFALAGVVLTIAQLYGGAAINLPGLIFTIGMVITVSYATHCTYANIKFRQLVRRVSITMNGQVQEWLRQ